LVELMKEMYRMMVRIRAVEEALVEPILSGEVKTPCHLCSGQEAVSVGVCSALDKGDMVFGNHRSHGHFLAKGGSLREMLAEIFCTESGCSRGRGGSMHLIDPDCGMLGSAPIVAGTISLTVGAALASSIRKDRAVAVSFFGDGATGEGVLYESLNFAALKKLPVLFVCENNLYATHMPIRECRVDIPIAEIGKPFGIEGRQVDGNDVIAVYETAKLGLERCRAGEGPIFLECLTYRMRGHVGPDDNIQGCHTDIRQAEEIAAWRERDPIAKFEKYLSKDAGMRECGNAGMRENGRRDFDEGMIRRNGLREELSRIRKEVAEEVSEAIAFAKGSAFPDREGMGKYVFSQ